MEISSVNTGNACISKGQEHCAECKIEGEHVTLVCGRQVQVLNLAYECKKPMPVAEGRMPNSNRTVSVLRDTGSSAMVIRSNLVQESDYTGKKEMVILINGTVRLLPTAIVIVETPYFSGKISVESTVVENPIYDIIIGNTAVAINIGTL